MADSFTIKNIEVGRGRPFFILGPCGLESEEFAWAMARSLKKICERVKAPFFFKASYDKANRTAVDSYRGPGVEEGCRILGEIGKELGVPVTTDIHTEEQAAQAAEHIDLLQVPAFLCRQTDLLEACAKTGRPVNVKKGQFLAPWDMEHVVAKARQAGGRQIMVTERGASFGYGNLVNDFRSLEIMREFGAAVVFDATHSVQLPGAGGDKSSGERRFIAPLARAAVAVGVDGLFMEVHEDPDHALSDGPNSLHLADLPDLIDSLLAIDEARRGSS